MSDSLVRLEENDGVVHVVLTRSEKRNALTRTMIEQITSVVKHAIESNDTRVMVIESEGPVFCAGMDLGEMQQRAGQPDANDQWRVDSEVYRELVGAIFQAPFPTIAKVQGAAVAGGLGLVVACDMVVAGESAFFALPEPMRGITAAMVAPLLMMRVGSGHATSLLLSGERCDAVKARNWGLVYDVVPDDQLQARVELLSRNVRSGSQSALRLTKQHIHDCMAAAIDPLLDRSLLVSAEARETEDAREGLAAFLEKRPTRWQPDDQ